MKWLGEMMADDKGRPSSMRVMMLIGMIGGMGVLVGTAFGIGDCSTDYSTTLTFLFGGILGAKAWQKHAETKS